MLSTFFVAVCLFAGFPFLQLWKLHCLNISSLAKHETTIAGDSISYLAVANSFSFSFFFQKEVNIIPELCAWLCVIL